MNPMHEHWRTQTFASGTRRKQAENEFANLERARGINPDHVVKAVKPADPQQGWLIKERVYISDAPQNLAQRTRVLNEYRNVNDAGSNLMWGYTASNPTPRWILIE